MVADVDGVAGDELRGGDGLGGEVSLGLRWFPIKITLPPKLPSAAELAAGDFLHLRRPYDYRSNHLGP